VQYTWSGTPAELTPSTKHSPNITSAHGDRRIITQAEFLKQYSMQVEESSNMNSFSHDQTNQSIILPPFLPRHALRLDRSFFLFNFHCALSCARCCTSTPTNRPGIMFSRPPCTVPFTVHFACPGLRLRFLLAQTGILPLERLHSLPDTYQKSSYAIGILQLLHSQPPTAGTAKSSAATLLPCRDACICAPRSVR
jgi:hypothetical protein